MRKRLPERVDAEEKSFMEFAEYLCSLRPNNLQSMISFFQKSSFPTPVKAFMYRQLFYLSHYFLNHVLWGKSLENFDIFSCLSNHFLAPPGHLYNPPSALLNDEKWPSEIWTHYNRFKDSLNQFADDNQPLSSPSLFVSPTNFNVDGVLSQIPNEILWQCYESLDDEPLVNFSDIDFDQLFKSQK